MRLDDRDPLARLIRKNSSRQQRAVAGYSFEERALLEQIGLARLCLELDPHDKMSHRTHLRSLRLVPWPLKITTASLRGPTTIHRDRLASDVTGAVAAEPK